MKKQTAKEAKTIKVQNIQQRELDKLAAQRTAAIDENDHDAAVRITAEIEAVILTHKEINAMKRASAYETTSIFTKSINYNSSCYQLECLLNEFRTESELFKLMNSELMLERCNTKIVTRSRIKAHLSHLKRKFVNTVRFIEKRENAKIMFKFELK